MKIIGTQQGDLYIALISASEINTVMNNAYGTDKYRDMTRLKFGDEVDLSIGHKFSQDIRRSCENMIQATQGFAEAQKTLLSFAQLIVKEYEDAGE